MATTGTGPGAATGNTPTGNPGAGTHETTSAPTIAPAGTAPDAGPAGGAPAAPTADVVLDDAAFRQDGNLRKDVSRKISENTSARGAERSYNEVTDETTVTTTVDGRTVTFTEDGDTRTEG
jgi:hypothetical protein